MGLYTNGATDYYSSLLLDDIKKKESSKDWSLMDSIHKNYYLFTNPNFSEDDAVNAWRLEQNGDSNALWNLKNKKGGDRLSYSFNPEYGDAPNTPEAAVAVDVPEQTSILKGTADAEDDWQGQRFHQALADYKAKQATAGVMYPDGGGSYMSSMPPNFSSAAGDYYSNLMNTKPDTENPWNADTQGLLDRILNYKPETTGDYAREAYGKIVKNLVGIGLPSVDNFIRSNVLQDYKNDVAAQAQNTAVNNQSALQSLIGEGLSALKNIRNPVEASALASALQNIGAKGFSSGMYNGNFVSPAQASALGNIGANGLMRYDGSAYGSALNNMAAGQGSLEGNFQRLVKEGKNWGTNGCGYFANALLDGNPMQSLISPDCEATVANAVAKKAWIPNNGGYIPRFGDCILLKKPNSGNQADHIVISDGRGGYFGNSSSKADAGQASANYSNSLGKDFGNYTVLGFIPSGQYFGRGNISRGKTSSKQDNSEQKAYNSVAGIIESMKVTDDPKELEKLYNKGVGIDPSASAALASHVVDKLKAAKVSEDVVANWDQVARQGLNNR